MKATLWDGTKQLHGRLQLLEKGLTFSFDHFSKSSLNLDIQYNHIDRVALYRVYKLALEGLEIVTIDGGCNIFVTEEAGNLKKLLENKITRNSYG